MDINKNSNEKWIEVDPLGVLVWEYKNTGDEIVGYLEKIEENIGPNKSRMYTLRKEDGDFVKVWGSTLLDKRFDFISLSEKVKIVYQGKKKAQKGGREYHDFKVFHISAKNPENQITNDEIPVIEEEELPDEV